MKLLDRILLGKTNNVLIQIFRYTFVGGFAFLVDYGLLIFLTECCSLYYLLSAVISFIAGLIVNYIISTKWVFGKSEFSNKYIEFIMFALVGVIGLGLNTLFLYLLTELVQIHYAISKIITAILVYLWNFFARRFLIFDARK